MNVDRFPVQGPFIGEHLHLINQVPDAVGLFANQFRERPVVAFENGFEQLRRPPNSGKRIFNFMGQHGGHAGYRPRRTTVGKLQIKFLGH